MRKSIKIKSITIFLAWLVIFAHSIIPHNHHQDQFDYLKGFIHFVADNCEEQSPVLTNDFDHVKSCQFTNNLFHQLNSENLLFASEDKTHKNFLNVICIVFSNEKEQVIPDFILYPNSLRAPPSFS
jgi:hypothetical protein